MSVVEVVVALRSLERIIKHILWLIWHTNSSVLVLPSVDCSLVTLMAAHVVYLTVSLAIIDIMDVIVLPLWTFSCNILLLCILLIQIADIHVHHLVCLRCVCAVVHLFLGKSLWRVIALDLWIHLGRLRCSKSTWWSSQSTTHILSATPKLSSILVGHILHVWVLALPKVNWIVCLFHIVVSIGFRKADILSIIGLMLIKLNGSVMKFQVWEFGCIALSVVALLELGGWPNIIRIVSWGAATLDVILGLEMVHFVLAYRIAWSDYYRLVLDITYHVGASAFMLNVIFWGVFNWLILPVPGVLIRPIMLACSTYWAVG